MKLGADILWSTALAIAVFSVYFDDMEKEWNLIRAKAKKYLAKELAKLHLSHLENQILEDALQNVRKYVKK